jgi:hypothetical protein
MDLLLKELARTSCKINLCQSVFSADTLRAGKASLYVFHHFVISLTPVSVLLYFRGDPSVNLIAVHVAQWQDLQ